MQPVSGETTTQKVDKLMGVEKGVILDYQEGLKSRISLDFNSQDNNNPWIALESLRRKTDHSVSGTEQTGCKIVKDEFVYKSSDCTYSTKYTSS